MLGWSRRVSTSASRSIRWRARAMSSADPCRVRRLSATSVPSGPAAEVDDAHAAAPEAGHPLVAHVTRLTGRPEWRPVVTGRGYRGRND